jgi:hypothetical protein
MLWYPRRRLLYWVFTLVIWVWHSIPQVIRASYHRPRMLRARAWHCLRGKIDLKTSATNLILADKQGGDRSLITLPPLALAQRSSSGPFFCLPLAQSACSEMKSPARRRPGRRTEEPWDPMIAGKRLHVSPHGASVVAGIAFAQRAHARLAFANPFRRSSPLITGMICTPAFNLMNGGWTTSMILGWFSKIKQRFSCRSSERNRRLKHRSHCRLPGLTAIKCAAALTALWVKCMEWREPRAGWPGVPELKAHN